MLAALILSAGASSRMGRPKALLPYREGTFLQHLIDVTRHPKIGVTRIVLGSGADRIAEAAKLDPSEVVLNPDWEQGQLSSICAGVRSLSGLGTEGMILCPVDHPLISAGLVADLIEHFYKERRPIVIPTYNGKRGHPVIISSALYDELLAAPPAKGARAVVWAHQAEIVEVPADEEGIILNLNDPDMLRKAQEKLAD